MLGTQLVAILPECRFSEAGETVVDQMYGPRPQHVICRLGIEPGMDSAHAETSNPIEAALLPLRATAPCGGA